MASWPVTLPRPSYSGYQLSPADQTVRTDMEVGAARQRRRTSARNDQVSVPWIFTDAQMAIFRAWYYSATGAAGGSSWFSIDLAIGDIGLATYEARFVGPWQSNALPGLIWQVSAKVEIR